MSSEGHWNKDIVEEFYFLTLIDLRDGISIQELEETIKLYEQHELYEECAGILKGLEEYKYDTINNLNEKANRKTKGNSGDGKPKT